MKNIKTFESYNTKFKIGDYIKEFIPGFGYRYYYITNVKEFPTFKGSPVFYNVIDLSNNKENVFLKGYVTDNKWELSSEEQYKKYLIELDAKKYNL